MRRADDLHAAVPERRHLEARRRPDTLAALLDAAAACHPAAARHAHDALTDADIAAQVEGVVAGLQVEDTRAGRVGCRRHRVVLGGATAGGDGRGGEE